MTRMHSPPLVLTLKIDESAFQVFDEMRRKYFPPERNFLPAHITLFHALPGEQAESVRETLRAICSAQSALKLDFPRPRFLGRGVALDIDCAELIDLRAQLAAQWWSWLGRQDQQRYKPHLTVQNKVVAEDARLLFEELEQRWKAFQCRGEGLLLWTYVGGPWEPAGEFAFSGQRLP